MVQNCVDNSGDSRIEDKDLGKDLKIGIKISRSEN